MPDRTYSTYEAKARFSEILRRVREGETVTIQYRGEPVAEIRPLPADEEPIAGRLRRLAERGALVREPTPATALEPVAKRPGALERFLADRE